MVFYKVNKGIGQMINKNSENGRSMVEMMGYLMVVMGVIISIGRIVSSAFDNHKYSTASLQLTEFVGAMVKASAIDYDYSEVVSKANGAKAKELVPDTYRVVVSGDTAKIYHAFGGTVSVDTVDEGAKLQVKYEKLSKKQCVELAMKDWSKNQYADLFSLAVNGTTWYWQAYGTSYDDEGDNLTDIGEGKCSGDTCVFPVRRSALTGGQCADGLNNTLIWVFN